MANKRPRQYAAEAKRLAKEGKLNSKREQYDWILANAPEKYHAMIFDYMRGRG